MAQPALTVLGVYKPQISAETWQEQFASTGGYTEEHFAGLVLIEALAGNIDVPLDPGQIGQMSAEHPEDPRYMQVSYEEGLLSLDGEQLLARGFDWKSGEDRGSFRFAFYLHFYDSARPLRWQYGEVTCPPVQDAPARLMTLMPYTACD